MAKNRVQKDGSSGSRLDLAARLLRPNWPSFLRRRHTARRFEATQHLRRTIEPRTPSRLPLDIFCAGMYRACSTWQYEVVAHLIERAHDGRRLGYLTSEQYTRLVETDVKRTTLRRRRKEGLARAQVARRRSLVRRALAERRALAVYAYRDVRDVVFSLMHKRGVTFEQLLRDGMIHQILANDRFWMARPDVLIQRYEDLLAEPARGVKELARHLGIVLEESEAARIAGEYSHESNRARAEALRRRLQEAGVDLENAANVQICDPKTLLHWNHMRQGGSGSWRSTATPSQRSMLERLCGRWLEARGYPDRADRNRSKRPFAHALRERARGEADLWVGRSTFLIRACSQHFPATARTVKRLLGLPVAIQVGATAWADPVPLRPPAGRDGEARLESPIDAAAGDDDRSVAGVRTS